MNLRRLVFFFVFVCLVVDNPQERPFSGMWESPLAPIGALIYENLHKITGLSVLRFSGLDLALGALLLFAAFRRPAGGVPLANGLSMALAGTFLALVWLEMWGIVRGGDFKSSLWQFRQLIWLPGVVYIFARMMRDSRDFVTAGKIVIASAVIKVALGLYFKMAIVPTLEREPNFVTSHSDSLLFVTALFIVVANYLQTRSKRAVLLAMWVVPIILVGLVINNRRLAFVSFGAGLCVMYALLQGPAKRLLQKTAVVMSPFLLMYIIAGRNHGDTPILKPAASIASVFLQKDRSSATRDIENYNLIQTLKRNKLLGSGFGHEYVELVKADDISSTFAMYRYIGHNSVLWLFGVAGLAGFIAVWMFLAVGVYFATRAFRYARTPPERAAAEVSAAVIMAYVIQAWGDMGLQSWVGIFVLAGALTIAGKLAVSTGAWRQGAI